MEHDKTTTDQVVTAASDWISTALAIPLVWPKMTALVCVAVIGLSTYLLVVPQIRALRPPPPPNATRIEQMLRAVEERDQAVRQREGFAVQPNPEMPGVFQTMRDRPPVPETEP